MIRKIEVQDASAVARISREALGHSTSAELLEQNIIRLRNNPAYYICVCCEEDHPEMVTGFIQAQRYDLLYGDSGFHIIALAAAPEAQGKGVGSQLMQALETWARAHGAAFIRLNSRVERTQAHKFYEHLGYQCDKTQKRFIKYFSR